MGSRRWGNDAVTGNGLPTLPVCDSGIWRGGGATVADVRGTLPAIHKTDGHCAGGNGHAERKFYFLLRVG